MKKPTRKDYIEAIIEVTNSTLISNDWKTRGDFTLDVIPNIELFQKEYSVKDSLTNKINKYFGVKYFESITLELANDYSFYIKAVIKQMSSYPNVNEYHGNFGGPRPVSNKYNS
jgi:hypothetical protein